MIPHCRAAKSECDVDCSRKGKRRKTLLRSFGQKPFPWSGTTFKVAKTTVCTALQSRPLVDDFGLRFPLMRPKHIGCSTVAATQEDDESPSLCNIIASVIGHASGLDEQHP